MHESPRSAQEAFYKLLIEKEQRQRRNPLRFLKPHQKQDQFLETLARIAIFLGANQSGKTVAGLMKAIAHSYGYKFWQVEDLDLVTGPNGKLDLPRRDAVPSKFWVRRGDGLPIAIPNRGIVLTGLSARRGLGECIWPTFLDWWPTDLKVHTRYMMSGVPAQITLPNASSWSFGSGEQAELSTEAFTAHWAWCDEPVPQKFWTGLWRGLVRNFGPAWFTLTPLGSKAAWLYQDFIAPSTRRDYRQGSKTVKVAFFEVMQRENPHLAEQAVVDFENDPTMTEQERQARLYGKFEFLSNRVYPMFLPAEPFVVEPFEIPPEWKRVVVCDPHTARPYFMIWAAQSPTGAWYIYREYPEEDFTKLNTTEMGLKDYVLLIHGIEGRTPSSWRIMDPNYGRQRRKQISGMTERSVEEQFAEYGVDFDTDVSDDLERGHEAVRDMLRYNIKLGIGPDNEPKIRVFATCRNTVNSLTNYGFLESKTPGVRSEKVSEEWKDPADCVRYLAMYSFPHLGDGFSYLEKPLEELEDDE